MSEWEVRLSNSKGLPYFFNTNTRQSIWDTPAGLTQEDVNKLPGAELLSGDKPKADQVRASHLLVKHRDSRRASSWKEPVITRTKDEAIDILTGYETDIAGSADKFAELAEKYSDCASHSNNGDLGFFGRGQMQKPFEDAAYALAIGQISGIITTDSGVHLVMRTG